MTGFLGRVWHRILGDLLDEVQREDPGHGARRVVASGPPLGVTWWQPYRLGPEELVFWRGGGEHAPIIVHPKDFETFSKAIHDALKRPRNEEALALQLRMAERYPTS